MYWFLEDSIISKKSFNRKFVYILPCAHEKPSVVELRDERVAGLQGGAGVLAKIAAMRLAVAYNCARIKTVSMKVEVAF